MTQAEAQDWLARADEDLQVAELTRSASPALGCQVPKGLAVFLDKLPDGGPRSVRVLSGGSMNTEQWACVFDGRAGARARAVFPSVERAKQFAERHAQLTSTGLPLKWDDSVEPIVLTTPSGDYRIVLTASY